MLLRRGETLLDPSLRAGTVGERAVHFRLIGRAGSTRLVDEINGKSGAEKIRRPTFSAIGRALKVVCRLSTAVNHDDRIGMLCFVRDLIMHIHLVGHDVVIFGDGNIATAHEEEALFSDDQRIARGDRHGIGGA